MMNMFSILTVVLDSQVHAYIKTGHILLNMHSILHVDRLNKIFEIYLYIHNSDAIK